MSTWTVTTWTGTTHTATAATAGDAAAQALGITLGTDGKGHGYRLTGSVLTYADAEGTVSIATVTAPESATDGPAWDVVRRVRAWATETVTAATPAQAWAAAAGTCIGYRVQREASGWTVTTTTGGTVVGRVLARA